MTVSPLAARTVSIRANFRHALLDLHQSRFVEPPHAPASEADDDHVVLERPKVCS